MSDPHVQEFERLTDRIEERIAVLVRTVLTLRDENHSLRATADRHETENRLLRERLDLARTRVEHLIARIPADS